MCGLLDCKFIKCNRSVFADRPLPSIRVMQLPIGNIDGEFFTPLSHYPTKGSVALAKKIQVDPTVADAQLSDLEKGEELRQPWVHDSEFSIGCVRL